MSNEERVLREFVMSTIGMFGGGKKRKSFGGMLNKTWCMLK